MPHRINLVHDFFDFLLEGHCFYVLISSRLVWFHFALCLSAHLCARARVCVCVCVCVHSCLCAYMCVCGGGGGWGVACMHVRACVCMPACKHACLYFVCGQLCVDFSILLLFLFLRL